MSRPRNPRGGGGRRQSGTTADFTLLATGPGIQDFAGLGARAFWEPDAGRLLLLKNGPLVTIEPATALSNTPSPERRLEMAKQLGTIAVARR